MREAKIIKATVKGTTMRYAGRYITNGHWLLERSALAPKQQAQFASEEAMAACGFADPDCDHAMDESKVDKGVLDRIGADLWTVTNIALVRADSDNVRVLTPHADNAVDKNPERRSITVAEKYLTLLGIETFDELRGDVNGALRVTGDGPVRVIMPVRPIKGEKIPAIELAS